MWVVKLIKEVRPKEKSNHSSRNIILTGILYRR